MKIPGRSVDSLSVRRQSQVQSGHVTEEEEDEEEEEVDIFISDQDIKEEGPITSMQKARPNPIIRNTIFNPERIEAAISMRLFL